MSAIDADLHFLTISEASKLIESRKLSPVELAEALLKRVDALEPQLNAFITPTADRALDDARRAEDAIMGGKYHGPLHGIPYGLKDIYCTKGIRTTGHSKVCADYVPDFDATTVRKLDEGGGVLFGKLSTHEFAHGGPSFDLPWPPARNPWKREHVTGGSSSGSGAGVAAGFFMGAMGSDTGGSIRNPAALCGLVGLKPTYGLVSRYGVYANSFTYDHAGPLTWTVEDCAIMMQALAGHDPLDPASATNPIPDYRAALTGDIRGLRIGVIRHFYEEDIKVAPAVKDALEAAYDVLRSLGAVLEDVRIRPAQDYYDVKIVSAESELYAVHEANLRSRPGDFGEDFLGRSLAAIFIRGSDYIQALRERRQMIAEMAPLYEKYDLFVTAGPGPAPRLDAWRTIQFWKSASLATPFNVTGGPALVQCIGYTEDGLPLSMQVVGKPFDDALVMRAAHAYEKATPWRDRRPALDPAAEFSTALPPVPEPEPDPLSERERDEVAATCRRAGLALDARAFQQLCATTPYIQAMVERLRGDRPFTEEPMNTHRFPG
jgi:aspartyl-tRNA(Asn)/glutamyl-tRNA(Gln) amidotransferase subunit A